MCIKCGYRERGNNQQQFPVAEVTREKEQIVCGNEKEEEEEES